MESHELVVAKINAAVKILEWAKDDIEPGIGGTPVQMYAALAEAFKEVYAKVSEAVAKEGAGAPDQSEPTKPEAMPIGGA